MVPADLIALKAAFDAMGTPSTDRVLVLCSDHINDLLLTDQKFRDAYNINQTEGKIARLYGFDIYEYNGTPYYTSAGNKRPTAPLPQPPTARPLWLSTSAA